MRNIFYLQAESANPSEVRRIFTIGVPYDGGHAGQILFGPADGYLYLMLSDGSNRDDPYNFAQNKRSLLGKILRIDVDRIPSKSSDLYSSSSLNISLYQDKNTLYIKMQS